MFVSVWNRNKFQPKYFFGNHFSFDFCHRLRNFSSSIKSSSSLKRYYFSQNRQEVFAKDRKWNAGIFNCIHRLTSSKSMLMYVYSVVTQLIYYITYYIIFCSLFGICKHLDQILFCKFFHFYNEYFCLYKQRFFAIRNPQWRINWT